MLTADPAYAEFVLAHQDRLRRAAFLMCGDAGLAEDHLQDALIELAARWESVTHPQAYLRRLIYRRSVSRWRRHRREVTVAALPEVGVDGEDQWVDALLVRSLVRALPPRQRAALVLRYFEGLSEADTAEVMGVRVGTVKSLSHQAIARLRDQLPADDHPRQRTTREG